jgi:hypothetical protein
MVNWSNILLVTAVDIAGMARVCDCAGLSIHSKQHKNSESPLFYCEKKTQNK